MTRFLVVQPYKAGISNTRLNIECAMALAHMTGRTLVLREDLYRDERDAEEHGARFRPLDPRHFLDLGTVPVAPMRDIPAGASNVTLPYASPDSYILAIEGCDGGYAPAFAAGRSIVPMTAEMEDATVLTLPPTLEPFYAWLLAGPAAMRDTRAMVRTSVRYHRHIRDVGESLASLLGDFHAVVIRRAEFLTQYPQADVSATAIADRLAEYVPDHAPLVIATDEWRREWFGPLTARFDVSFLRDIVLDAAPPYWSTWWMGCAEQVVCAMARTFTGTRLSTFSAYVNRLRGYYGMLDVRVRFTDGTPAMDFSTDRYSWQQWRASGQPMWGREFHEGWAT